MDLIMSTERKIQPFTQVCFPPHTLIDSQVFLRRILIRAPRPAGMTAADLVPPQRWVSSWLITDDSASRGGQKSISDCRDSLCRSAEAEGSRAGVEAANPTGWRQQGFLHWLGRQKEKAFSQTQISRLSSRTRNSQSGAWASRF